MKLILPEAGGPPSQPDPYVFKAGGKYYIYASGDGGVKTYMSEKLTEGWKYIGRAIAEKGIHFYWAPCVIERDGVYYMYYSSIPEGETDHHKQAVKVAVSRSPEGPFEYKKTVIPAFSIDPHVVKSGGEYYIFYSLNDYEAERAGTYIAVDRLADMFTAEGKPVPVVVPTVDEEIFMKDRFRPGQNWHTVEGAFYFREGNRHFLMYSGNCYQNEKYFVGYACAESAENDLRKVRFRKYPSDEAYAPLLAKNAEEEGTGHNSVIREGGEYYIVYHARDVSGKKAEDTRTARICKMRVDGLRLIAER